MWKVFFFNLGPWKDYRDPNHKIIMAHREVEELLVDGMIGLHGSVSHLNVSEIKKKTPSAKVHVFKPPKKNVKFSKRLRNIHRFDQPASPVYHDTTSASLSRSASSTCVFNHHSREYSPCNQMQQRQQQQLYDGQQVMQRRSGRARRFGRHLLKRLRTCTRPQTMH